MLLNEKASELRSKVFELLTDWEKNQKMALEKSEIVSNIVDDHETEVEQLIKEVEATLDEAKNTLVAEIRLKFIEFSSAGKWFEIHVEKVGQAQAGLRSLLCQTNGTLVASFSDFESEIRDLSLSHSKLEQHHMNKEKFDTLDGIKFLSKKIVAELRNEIKLPQEVMNESPEPVEVKKLQPETGIMETTKLSPELRFRSIAGCFTDESYEISQRDRSVYIRKYDAKGMHISSGAFSKVLGPDSILVNQVFLEKGTLVIVTSGFSK